MKRLRWQILIVILSLAAIAVLLLGQQPPALAPEPVEVEPVTGGSYTEALVGSPGRLNPLLDFNNLADREVNRLLYARLVRFDDRGLPQVELAESLGISQDGKVFNLSIRADAVWHDGSPVIADDVIFTTSLLKNPALPIPADLRTFWEQVEVRKLDERTLQFQLPEPFAPFLDYLSFGVLPAHLLRDIDPQTLIDADINRSPVGSGPYRFDRWLIEDGQIRGVALAAFDEYFAGRAFIDEVVFRYYPDSPAAYQAYQAGEVQGVSQVSADVLPAALKDPNLRLYTGRQPRLILLYFNLGNEQKPFFDDAAVRRALLLAINRQWLIDRLFGGQAIPANGPILPGSWAYYEGLEAVPFDLAAAETLLKDAGYTIPAEGGSVRAKDGVPLSFQLLYPDTPQFSALARAIRENWAKIGVEVSVQAVSFEELLTQHLQPHTYDAALVELNMSRYPDPDPYPFWDQAQITGGQNYARWDDRQASEYLERARITVDLNERARLYRNFQIRWVEELPALPLFYPVYTYGVDQAIQGVTLGPLADPAERFAGLQAWFLLAQRPTPTP